MMRPGIRRALMGVVLPMLGQIAWSADIGVGLPAPPIEAKLLNGEKTIRIDGPSDKVTIINFWATWCAPCREEMPAIQAYYDKHKAQGLQVVAISMDDPRQVDLVKRLAQPFSFQFALKADAKFQGLGRIWRMPSTFVVDRQGILRKNGHEGDPSVDEALLEAVVTPLLAK